MKDAYIVVGFLQIILILFMQWQVYLKKMVLTFAVSSVAIAVLLFVNFQITQELSLLILALLTLFVRAIFIPSYILKKLKPPHREREVKQTIPTSLSIIISVLLVVFSYTIYRTALFSNIDIQAGFIPIAIIIQGMFLIASRNNAFVQLIGYMVIENGLFLFGGYMFPDLPFVIEGGILLDLIGVVMVSAIIMRLREESVSDVIDEFEEFRG
ncbi:hypothetical protein [Hippea sp. KM1]|uniref:hypothetical protein n=1 Tax=Hippea sp. KM1 TaxID=944481 RepID=UPI00046CC460|nr:hypothetical protein [Hippea sp. KM1]